MDVLLDEPGDEYIWLDRPLRAILAGLDAPGVPQAYLQPFDMRPAPARGSRRSTTWTTRRGWTVHSTRPGPLPLPGAGLGASLLLLQSFCRKHPGMVVFQGGHFFPSLPEWPAALPTEAGRIFHYTNKGSPRRSLRSGATCRRRPRAPGDPRPVEVNRLNGQGRGRPVWDQDDGDGDGRWDGTPRPTAYAPRTAHALCQMPLTMAFQPNISVYTQEYAMSWCSFHRCPNSSNSPCGECEMLRREQGHAPSGAPPPYSPRPPSAPIRSREPSALLMDFIEPIGLVVVICAVVGAAFGWFDALATAAPPPHEAFHEHGWGLGAKWGAGIGILLGSAMGAKTAWDRS